MTLEEMIAEARRLSRTTESAVTDVKIGEMITTGQWEFCKEGGGLWLNEYLTLDPQFDLRTNFYIKVTLATASASFAVTSTDLNRISGVTAASCMASNIQGTWAAATIDWDTDAWRFTIEIPGESSIAVGSPEGLTNIDATNLMLGGGNTQATATWLSAFPEECTLETSLPYGFYSMDHVVWDGSPPLTPAPFDIFIAPNMRGDPAYYSIRNKKIRVYPVPDEQKLFQIYYRGLPSDSSLLDREVQMAPVYYAASLLAEGNFEKDVADRMFARYRKIMLDFKQNAYNQNPQMFVNDAPARLWYKVDM